METLINSMKLGRQEYYYKVLYAEDSNTGIQIDRGWGAEVYSIHGVRARTKNRKKIENVELANTNIILLIQLKIIFLYYNQHECMYLEYLESCYSSCSILI